MASKNIAEIRQRIPELIDKTLDEGIFSSEFDPKALIAALVLEIRDMTVSWGETIHSMEKQFSSKFVDFLVEYNTNSVDTRNLDTEKYVLLFTGMYRTAKGIARLRPVEGE